MRQSSEFHRYLNRSTLKLSNNRSSVLENAIKMQSTRNYKNAVSSNADSNTCIRMDYDKCPLFDACNTEVVEDYSEPSKVYPSCMEDKFKQGWYNHKSLNLKDTCTAPKFN